MVAIEMRDSAFETISVVHTGNDDDR